MTNVLKTTLPEDLDKQMAEILFLDRLKHKIEFLRSRNKDLKIAATNGCFDILHIGHIRFLQKAKTLGDILVVGINSDDSVKKIKGNNRPINNEDHRAEILASLFCVDIVSIFNEDNALRFLETFKPDIYVKGEEYDLENLQEAKFVRSYGGKSINVPLIPDFSTTKIIERIKKN